MNEEDEAFNEIERKAKQRMEAVRAVLESQEPMLLFQSHRDNFWCVDLTCKKCYSADFRLMHTHPPQRTWVGLTDDEIERLIHNFGADPWTLLDEVEARLKSRNT